MGESMELQPDGYDRLVETVRGRDRLVEISPSLCRDCERSGNCVGEDVGGFCGPDTEQDRLSVEGARRLGRVRVDPNGTVSDYGCHPEALVGLVGAIKERGTDGLLDGDWTQGLTEKAADREWAGGMSTPEPPPAEGWGDVARTVVDDLLERREMGQAKYGRALQFGNGRRYERDMYQELMDTLIYARGLVEEMDRVRQEASRWHSEALRMAGRNADLRATLAIRDVWVEEGKTAMAKRDIRIKTLQGDYERVCKANANLRAVLVSSPKKQCGNCGKWTKLTIAELELRQQPEGSGDCPNFTFPLANDTKGCGVWEADARE